MLHILQELLVRVTEVSRRHHKSVDLQGFLAFAHRALRIVLGRLQMEAHPALGPVVFDPRNLAVGQNAVLPLRLVGVLDSLKVHLVVDLLDQLKPDNAVVGGLVGGKGALTFEERLGRDGLNMSAMLSEMGEIGFCVYLTYSSEYFGRASEVVDE